MGSGSIGGPSVAFAVAEKEPQLGKLLGTDPAWLVSLKECSFGGLLHVAYVWWNGAKRKANLNWTTNDLNDNDWAVFVR